MYFIVKMKGISFLKFIKGFVGKKVVSFENIIIQWILISANIYLFQVNNSNAAKKTWNFFKAFLVFLLLTLNK